MDISELLKYPKSGWLGHREKPGSYRIEKYQPHYFYNGRYICAEELLFEVLKDYCLGDFEICISIKKNGSCEIKILDEDGDVFSSSNEESYEEALVAISKSINPDMFK